MDNGQVKLENEVKCGLLAFILSNELPGPRLSLLFLAPSPPRLGTQRQLFSTDITNLVISLRSNSSSKMSLHLRLVAILAIVCSHIQYGDALLTNCYAPSGAQDFRMFACQPQASESSCCFPGDVCYSNGLCVPGPTETGPFLTSYYLNGCTDTSFAPPNCVPNCLTSEFYLSMRH
jgi:hypothetical protein